VSAPLEDGWVAPELAAEFPELRLATTLVECAPGTSPPGLRRRLQMEAARMNGARAIRLRSDPVPSAYRIFFRLIGLDPDDTRTPIEEAAMRRLIHGDYESHGRVDDALLLGLVETGVPLYAFDEDTLDGPPGLRAARAGERLGQGEYANDLPPGRLIVADAARPLGVLFGAAAPEHRVTRASRRVRVLAVGVAGVPAIHVEEAVWACVEALQMP
jgi:DNA/RNA-binding domain of Phe-tRNA-synthetase-like protein